MDPTVTAAAVPLVLIAAWVGWRALSGRPLRRYALNGIVGLLVLVYFGITAGLGIFWVSKQELPVFDLHYLFGYLTLLIVIAHVTINVRPLVTFFRKSAPKAALREDGRAFRPSVAWTARAVGFVAFGGVCFWLGMGQGRQVIEVNGDEMSLAAWFHDATSHTRQSVRASRPIDWSRQPEPFKAWPDELPIVVLPTPDEPVEMTTAQALAAAEATVGPLSAEPISMRRLSTLLHLTNGITTVEDSGDVRYHKRAAPSSGALYPTIIYVAVGAMPGLAPGLHHYDVREHALRRVGNATPKDLGLRTTVALVLTTEFYRSTWKYDERGWRYCLLDAGHVATNTVLTAAAWGLAVRPVARFDDSELGGRLGLDPEVEAPLLVLPVGRTRRMKPGEGGEGKESLGEVIQRRRSVRRWSDGSLSKAELLRVLAATDGPSIEGADVVRRYVVVLNSEGVAAGVYRYVDGAGEGAERLEVVRQGDFSVAIYEAALFQKVARYGGAVFVATLATDDPHAYRYGAMSAGMMGERVYLMATALGLGVTGIGAFFDAEVNELIGVSPEIEHVVYLASFGRP